MIKYRLHSLAIATLFMVAGPWQYLAGQEVEQKIDRKSAARSLQVESVEPAKEPVQTKTYQFQSIDFPGAYASQLFDYNEKIAVGFSDDGVTFDSAFFFKSHVYKAIKAPSSATESRAYGVNTSGLIVGTYLDKAAAYHGFVFDGKNLLTFDYPGATNTVINDINDSGNMAGDFYQGASSQGFLYIKNKGTFTVLNYPSAKATHACGVNTADDVVGDFEDSAGTVHGFLWNNGGFSDVDYPGAILTLACGINDSGLIAGYYLPVSGPGHGFLFDGKTYTTVDVPNGLETALWKVKNNNNVVGSVLDSFGAYHGVIGR